MYIRLQQYNWKNVIPNSSAKYLGGDHGTPVQGTALIHHLVAIKTLFIIWNEWLNGLSLPPWPALCLFCFHSIFVYWLLLLIYLRTAWASVWINSVWIINKINKVWNNYWFELIVYNRSIFAFIFTLLVTRNNNQAVRQFKFDLTISISPWSLKESKILLLWATNLFEIMNNVVFIVIRWYIKTSSGQ